MITNRIVINLIRCHYEKDEEGFDRLANGLAGYFICEEKDQEQLGHYIYGLMSQTPTWCPQEIERGKV